MKKFTFILLFTVLMIPVLAQYEYHKPELNAAIQNQVYLNQPLKSGTPAIKLDSVISTIPPTVLPGSFTTPVKEIYEYDSNNRLSRITEKAWHPSKKIYGITGKKLFFYNTEGMVDSISFNTNGLSMRFSFKYIYDYKGRLETALRYSLQYGKWSVADKIVCSYNDLGKLSEIKCHEGSSFDHTGYLGLVSTFNFSYNEAGKLTEYKRISSWEDFFMEKTLYEWDSDGNLITQFFEDYIWGDKIKTEYLYNAVGDRIKSNIFYLENSEWELSAFDEYFYCDFNCTDLVYMQNPRAITTIDPLEFELNLFNKSTKAISEVAHTNGNGVTLKTAFYYSPIVVASSKEINNSEICVYPNPATEQITFTWNQNFDRLNLKLFQITGACVMDMEISSQENISVKNLQNGMYLYRLSNGNQTIKSGKLVKK